MGEGDWGYRDLGGPDCEAEVFADNWLADPVAHPWRMQCPHCQALFAKNDFAAYYASGLDEGGQLEQSAADASLLHHAEHANPEDPLHEYGVDDGHGYCDGDKTWHFIGAYIRQGPWGQTLQAVGSMADAYLLSRLALFFGVERYREGAEGNLRWLYANRPLLVPLMGPGKWSTYENAPRHTFEMNASGYLFVTAQALHIAFEGYHVVEDAGDIRLRYAPVHGLQE